MGKKNSKKQAVKVEPQLLKPSEALTRLQPQTIEGAREEGSTFEQIRYGFELGPIGIFIPSGMVCEVIDMQRIFLLPNAPKELSGLINLRGNLVPVFDLSRLLRVQEENTEGKDKYQDNLYMLIIGSDVKAMAFVIKALPQPIPTEQHEPELPPIAEYARKFVINAYSFQHRTWIDLDLEAFLVSLHSQQAA